MILTACLMLSERHEPHSVPLHSKSPSPPHSVHLHSKNPSPLTHSGNTPLGLLRINAQDRQLKVSSYLLSSSKVRSGLSSFIPQVKVFSILETFVSVQNSLLYVLYYTLLFFFIIFSLINEVKQSQDIPNFSSSFLYLFMNLLSL